MIQIKFEGQYDKDLFFKAVALANRPPKNRQRLLSILLVVAIGAIIVIGYRIITTREWVENFVYLAAAIFMGGYVGYIFLRPYNAARKLWADLGTRRALKGVITKRGITYVFPQGENTIEWEKFNRQQSTDKLVTIIRKDGLLVIFPRRFFKSEGNWQKFNTLVGENVIHMDEKGIQRPTRPK